MKERLLQLLFGYAGRLLQVVLQQLADRHVFDKVLQLAETYVNKLDGQEDLSNAEKRNAALRGIKADLAGTGVTVRDSLLNLGLELALSALRAKQGS